MCDPAVTRRASRSDKPSVTAAAQFGSMVVRLWVTLSRDAVRPAHQSAAPPCHHSSMVDAKHATVDSGGKHEAASWGLRPDLDLGGPRRRLRSMGPRGSVATGHPADFVGGHGLVARLAHASKAGALRRMC